PLRVRRALPACDADLRAGAPARVCAGGWPDASGLLSLSERGARLARRTKGNLCMNRLALSILIVCLAGVLVGGCGQLATAAPPPPSPTPTADTSQSPGCKCNTQN